MVTRLAIFTLGLTIGATLGIHYGRRVRTSLSEWLECVGVILDDCPWTEAGREWD